MAQNFTINLDCFSSGQMGSKVWLCEELEKIVSQTPKEENIWLMGGWYGTLSLVLHSRGNINIKSISNFDLDEDACKLSHLINDNFKWEAFGAFSHFKIDINDIDYLSPSQYLAQPPSIVINTSTEHMTENTWFENVPKGTRLVLQSCNMPHEEHVNLADSVEALKSQYPLSKVEYAGEKHFKYDSPDSFSRYMLIGIK